MMAAYQSDFFTPEPGLGEQYNVPEKQSESPWLINTLPPQYGWAQLNTAAMWNLATGNALLGISDNGIAVGHQGLRQFSVSGQYIGGNYMYGWNVGRHQTLGAMSTNWHRILFRQANATRRRIV